MLSDCEKCWDTPCSCGYYYRDHTIEGMAGIIEGILSYYTPSERKEILKAINVNQETTKDEK